MKLFAEEKRVGQGFGDFSDGVFFPLFLEEDFRYIVPLSAAFGVTPPPLLDWSVMLA